MHRFDLGQAAKTYYGIYRTQGNMSEIAKYQHVNGHLDKCFLWYQLLLEQQLDVICDGLKNIQ